MGTAAALTRPSLSPELSPRVFNELRAFVGLAEKQPQDLSAKIASLFDSISLIADSLVVNAIEQKTAQDFNRAATSAFNDYVRVLRARADLMGVVFRGDIRPMETLFSQSLSMVEADMRDQGHQRFGLPLTEQALFTVWTLRKIGKLIWTVQDGNSRELDGEAKVHCEKLANEFAMFSAWANFHLECLTASIRLNAPIYPDVHPAVMEGLRAEVNAYGVVRQIVDHLVPRKDELQLTPYTWDEEDEELLSDSMHEMETETL